MIILKDNLKDIRSALYHLDILFMKIEIDRGGKISLGGGKICLGGGNCPPQEGVGTPLILNI